MQVEDVQVHEGENADGQERSTVIAVLENCGVAIRKRATREQTHTDIISKHNHIYITYIIYETKEGVNKGQIKIGKLKIMLLDSC